MRTAFTSIHHAFGGVGLLLLAACEGGGTEGRAQLYTAALESPIAACEARFEGCGRGPGAGQADPSACQDSMRECLTSVATWMREARELIAKCRVEQQECVRADPTQSLSCRTEYETCVEPAFRPGAGPGTPGSDDDAGVSDDAGVTPPTGPAAGSGAPTVPPLPSAGSAAPIAGSPAAGSGATTPTTPAAGSAAPAAGSGGTSWPTVPPTAGSAAPGFPGSGFGLPMPVLPTGSAPITPENVESQGAAACMDQLMQCVVPGADLTSCATTARECLRAVR